VLNQFKESFQECLAEFDTAWTEYEFKYVSELMVIEKDARRHIVEAIDLQVQIRELESQPQMKEELKKAQTDLIAKIGEINQYANQLGSGRSDFCHKTLERAQNFLNEDS